ncbi:hypothetical protein [Haloarcula marina]|nr:hypothetical protein [Halomicroarcula marina]
MRDSSTESDRYFEFERHNVSAGCETLSASDIAADRDVADEVRADT